MFDGGKAFYLPSNLHIIGTMNSVDKSISGFDVALRRRFGWFRLGFSGNALIAMIQHKCGKTLSITNIKAFLERVKTLNQAIQHEFSLSAEHEIGHTYFAEIADIIAQETTHGTVDIKPRHLRDLWLYTLEPLIEEYLGYDFHTEAVRGKIGTLKNEFSKLL